MNRLNPFPPFTAPYPLIFLSALSNMDEVAMVSNFWKTSLAKGKHGLPVILLAKLLIILTKNLPD